MVGSGNSDMAASGRTPIQTLARQIHPDHAVAAGRAYTAAQRAKTPLPPPPTPPRPGGVPEGLIRRVWIWGNADTIVGDSDDDN